MPGLADVPDTLRRAIARLHAALGPAAAGLRPAVLEQACVGYLTLRRTDPSFRAGLLAVADMDLPNTTERLWVLDLKNARVLHRSLVAHGEGSGHLRARRFSNREQSACTSLGFYRTAGSYDGIHGYSRRLEGLDKGENANAYNRYVVLHAADYASPAYARQHGHLGYSRAARPCRPSSTRPSSARCKAAPRCCSAARACTRAGSTGPRRGGGFWPAAGADKPGPGRAAAGQGGILSPGSTFILLH